jgi:hypothetical protein
MPTKVLKAWSKESGKTIKEAEDAWDSCKIQADKKFKNKDGAYWGYVNVCTRKKLGLVNKVSSVLEDWSINKGDLNV